MVPQLVPVVNEVREANRKTTAGNQCGAIDDPTVSAKKWLVCKVSQVDFKAQARNKTTVGSRPPGNPNRTAWAILSGCNRAKMSEQRMAVNKPIPLAIAKTVRFFSWLETSEITARQVAQERIESWLFPKIQKAVKMVINRKR